MSPPLAIVTEDIDVEALAWLRERCEVLECGLGGGGDLDKLLTRAHALIVRTYTHVDGALLARAPQLKVVGRAGVGLDNVDVASCRARGVEVVHTPDANTQAVAEYVVALLLDVVRPRERVTSAQSLVEWTRRRRGLVAATQLSDLRLGIVGLGRVGKRVARAALGLGMEVVFHDISDIESGGPGGPRGVGLDELLRTSDIVSIHVDARPGNRGFMHAGRLGLMKPGAIFINTSRGFVVEVGALTAFLNVNPEAIAIIDVHEPEPFGPDYPLLACQNARLYPHLGAATRAAHAAMSWVVKDVWRVLEGKKPEWPAP